MTFLRDLFSIEEDMDGIFTEDLSAVVSWWRQRRRGLLSGDLNFFKLQRRILQNIAINLKIEPDTLDKVTMECRSFPFGVLLLHAHL